MDPNGNGPSRPDRQSWWPPGRIEQPGRRPVRRPSAASAARRQPVWPVAVPRVESSLPSALPVVPLPSDLPALPTRPVAQRWTDLVDLHTHVLPGVDDGARDPAEAIAMLRMAEADGIRTVVATPHSASCDAARIAEGVAGLSALAADAGLSVRVVAGSEVRLEAGLAERYRAGELTTLNGTYYLLLELPLHGDWPPYLLDAIYELQVEGIVPILAHAERYPAVQEDPGILIELIVRGVLIQVNGMSLLDVAGPAERRAADWLVRTHIAHLVASDAHDLSTRPPRLQEALDAVIAITGPDYAAWMVESAAAVLAGAGVTLPDPQLPQRASLFQRVRRA